MRLRPTAFVALVASALVVISSHVITQSRNARRLDVINGLQVVDGEVLVQLRTGTPAERGSIETAVDADDDQPVGIGVWRRIHSRSHSVQTILNALRGRAEIVAIEPNYIVQTTDTLPNDPSIPWGLLNTGTPGADIHATKAWDITTGSAANVIGVVDTGLDYTHPDLAANIWSAPTQFTIKVAGVSITCPAGSHGFNAIQFAANNLAAACDPMDDNGHGTHTSGTVGAVGNNALGVVGVNWTTRIMGLKFLNSGGSGAVSDAVNAIDFALQTKAFFANTATPANVRAFSNSWGGGGASSALSQAIDRANSADALFVAAAGNSSSNNDTTPFYPAAYSQANVVAVAATTETDGIAGFSNYGPTSVDLGAPGTDVYSTWPGASYAVLSGTSMATPHVSGAAMLLLSACSLSTAQVKAALLNNVDLLPSLTGLVLTGGRLNVNAALQSCATPPNVTLTTPLDGATFTAPASIPLAATATDSDAVARVEFYQGNQLIGTSFTSPYGGSWTNVPVGAYTLTAKAYDVLGAAGISAPVRVIVQSPTNTLPAPWSSQDIGAVGVPGSSTDASGVFSITGGGADIWNNADAFQYAFQSFSGDGQMVAHIASQQNTDAWAKAGLMIRESTDAGARYFAVLSTPGNGTVSQQRVQTGGPSGYSPGSGSVPQWLKLTRSGTLFSAYTSVDGNSWTPIGSATISLGSSLLWGFAVASHSTSVASTAVFDTVSVASSTNTPPTVSLTTPLDGATYTAPASVALTATASDSNGIAKVEFYQGAQLLGTSLTSPYGMNWTNVSANSYTLTAKAYDNLGATTVSSPVHIVVQAANTGLPTPWTSQDVGSVGAAGNATYVNGTFTVAGSGSDIWDTADAFQYVYQSLSGDGQIVAHVASQQNINGWAKAGVMIRDDLTAGARYAAVLITPTNGIAFQRRTQANSTSAYTAAAGSVPRWLKLVRSGTTISGYASPDGSSWTLVDSFTLSMNASVNVGLAVTSHMSGTLSSAAFDNVSVVGANSPPVVTLTSPLDGAVFTAPATVALAANATDINGIAKVEFYQGSQLVATVLTAPYTASWSNVAAGQYSVTAKAYDSLGAIATSAPANITIQSSTGGLPTPWVAQDLGSVAAAGSSSYTNGTFTVAGSGADIWNGADAFQYLNQPLAGDGQIVARVASQQNTDPWAKAGLMIRESTAAGARYGAVFVTPGNGVVFQDRAQANGSSSYVPSSGNTPVWLRLVRSGSTITASRSVDGVTWTTISSADIGATGQVLVGMAVTSHHDGVTSTTTFDNVVVQ